MLFSQSIPEKVLENSTTSKFVSVLDSLQEYKQGMITDAVRTLNPALNMNEKWLRKYLTDYGFSDIPKGFPIRVIQQLLLNADTIMRLRGSQLGVELFISVCCLGKVTIGTSNFMDSPDVIFLNSSNYGYITDNNSEPFYLCDRNTFMGYSFLSVVANSIYFNGMYPTEQSAIISYLNKELPNYVGFTNNLHIQWQLNRSLTFYYHALLNPQYVNELWLSPDPDIPSIGL